MQSFWGEIRGGGGGWKSQWGPWERHQTWDAGLGSPPSHLYLSCWPLHLSAHDLELAVAGEEERLSTNDKWQSQNKHTSEGGEGEKELNHSFIIHQYLLVFSLTCGLCPSLSSGCLSLIFFLFTHSPAFVKMWGNLYFCDKTERNKTIYGIIHLILVHAVTKIPVHFFT